MTYRARKKTTAMLQLDDVGGSRSSTLISPVTMKENGAMTFSSGSRYGRSRSGSLLRSDGDGPEAVHERELPG